MDGKLFSDALLSLTGDELRTVYALQCDTGILDILSAKVTDLVSRGGNHFTEKLNDKVKSLRGTSDEELQLKLLLQLQQQLNIRGVHLNTEREFHELGEKIVSEMYRFMKKSEKDFDSYAGKQEQLNMSGLQIIVNYQLSKLFDQLGAEMDKASPEMKDQFVHNIKQFVDSLPAEKQEQLKAKLGVDDLTKEVIVSVLATLGPSILFAVIVEISGFAFYTTAVSLAAPILGLFGAGFGAYTALTSVIAILASPVFILALIGGGGFWMYHRQSRKLAQKLMPIVLLQIVLPFMNDPRSVDYEPAAGFWRTVFAQYQEHWLVQRRNEQEKAALEREIGACQSEIRSLEQTCSANRLNIKEKHREMKEQLRPAHSTLMISDRFRECSSAWTAAAEQIRLLQQEQRKEESELWEWVKRKTGNIGREWQISELRKKQERLLEGMLEDVLAYSVEFASVPKQAIAELERDNGQYRREIARLQEQKEAAERELGRRKQTIARCKAHLQTLEKTYYGLDHLSYSIQGQLE